MGAGAAAAVAGAPSVAGATTSPSPASLGASAPSGRDARGAHGEVDQVRGGAERERRRVGERGICSQRRRDALGGAARAATRRDDDGSETTREFVTRFGGEVSTDHADD